jgi:hypothetical protein
MEYFYCYDKSLMKHLRYDHNINFICCGLHPKTKIMFWQFVRESVLDQAIKGFTERQSNESFQTPFLTSSQMSRPQSRF